MMHAPDPDDEYVALLRERLPSEGDKERMRKRLAALGVGGGAALASAATQAQALEAKAGFSAVSKVLASLAGVVVVGSALYLGFSAAEHPRPPSAAQEPSSVPVAEPHAELQPAPPAQAEPRALEHSDPPTSATQPPKRNRAKKPGSLDTLSAENALLAAAVRAMHAGNAAKAARLLREHEQRYPAGLLREERERAQKKLEQAASPE